MLSSIRVGAIVVTFAAAVVAMFAGLFWGSYRFSERMLIREYQFCVEVRNYACAQAAAERGQLNALDWHNAGEYRTWASRFRAAKALEAR